MNIENRATMLFNMWRATMLFNMWDSCMGLSEYMEFAAYAGETEEE